MKTWYQLYYFDNLEDKIKSYGFSVQNGFIKDHPNKYIWEGEWLDLFKKFIISLPYFQVVKICDQVN